MFNILTKGVKDKRTIVIFLLIIKRTFQNFILYDHFYSHTIPHKVRNECVGKKDAPFHEFPGKWKVRCHYTHARMLKPKKESDAKCQPGWKKLEFSGIAGDSVNWFKTLRKH